MKVSASPVATLPADGFPALRELSAFQTRLPLVQVAAFRAAHPQCRVEYEWKRVLAEKLGDADRLVVRSGGTCHRWVAEERVLFETKDAAEVAELLALIEIDEVKSDGVCMCCGSPTLEFYRGEEHLAMVGIQHGEALRWGTWPADGRLMPNSSKAFTEWLAKRGVGIKVQRPR